MKPLNYAFTWLCRNKEKIAKALTAVQGKYLELPKEKQAKVRKATATNAAMADTTKLQQYSEAFKNQKKYSSLRGFIFAQEYEKLGA